SAAMFMLGIYVMVRRKPSLGPIPDVRISWRERFESLYGIWGIVVLFFIIMGGIYSGIVTPTYAGAVGAFGAFLIVLAKRRMNRTTLIETIKDATVTTSVIFIIVVGGMLFARFLADTCLVANVSHYLLLLLLSTDSECR